MIRIGGMQFGYQRGHPHWWRVGPNSPSMAITACQSYDGAAMHRNGCPVYGGVRVALVSASKWMWWPLTFLEGRGMSAQRDVGTLDVPGRRRDNRKGRGATGPCMANGEGH